MDSIVSINEEDEEDYKKAIDQIVVVFQEGNSQEDNSQEDNSQEDNSKEDNSKEDNSQEDKKKKNSLINCVTYSENDNLIIRWNRWIIKNDSQKKTESKCVKLNHNIRNIIRDSFVLNDKFLLCCYNGSEYKNDKYDHIARIDLEEETVRLIKLESAKSFRRNSMRVFPDGGVILVSLNNESKVYKIYECFNKQKDELTSIYEIEVPECLKEYPVNCFVYQTKLLLFCEYQMTLWDLNEYGITINKQFFLDHDTSKIDTSINVVINKDQTLLALSLSPDIIDIYLVETGIRISRYVNEGYNNLPLEFVTLQNGPEGLIISADSNDDKKLYKFLDPFLPSDAIYEIDITDFIHQKGNHIIMTKSNRILSIVENNVEITDGLTLQQVFNKTDEEFDGDFLENVDKHMKENKYKKHDEKLKEYEKFINIINDPVKFSKSYLEMLKIATKNKYNFVTESILDKIFEYAYSENYSNMSLLCSIDLSLFDLNYYEHSKLVKKFILFTSLTLDPVCSSVINSTSPHEGYSKNIYIKKIPSKLYKLLFSLFSIFSLLSLLPLLLLLYRIKKSLKPLEKKPSIRFIIPFHPICKYRDNDGRNFWDKILYKPESFLFCNIDSENFYKWWNFAAIIDFKWRDFGLYHYFNWFFYTSFICIFMITTMSYPEYGAVIDFSLTYLMPFSSLICFVYLYSEFLQMKWEPRDYFNDIWNLFDIGAYSLPIIITIYWYIYKYGDMEAFYFTNGDTNYNDILNGIISFSYLLLYFKFILFFRVFQSFGIYFVIIIGVAKKAFPFLIILFIVLFGFAHAFFNILRKDDNSWNLETKYYPIFPNNTIGMNPVFVESSENVFVGFTNSLLSMYLILLGTTDSLASNTYNSPIVAFFLFLFTFIVVIYLNNLFVGLLNLAIETCNKNEKFLLQKAKVIAEIEEIFKPIIRLRMQNPNWIYIDIPENEVRELIRAIDSDNTKFQYDTLYISKNLRKLLKIPEPINQSVQLERIQQQIIDLQKKLNELNEKIQ